MFILDDMVLRSLGLQLPMPFDTLSTLEAIEEAVMKELYNPEKLNNELREITALFSDGKISRKEFEKKKEDIILKLGIADKVKERGAKSRHADIKMI